MKKNLRNSFSNLQDLSEKETKKRGTNDSFKRKGTGPILSEEKKKEKKVAIEQNGGSR